jgi:hypothetical protein
MTGNHILAFLSEMNGESDRAVAIVCGTLVEDGLAIALRRIMLPLSRDDDDRLFGPDMPLGTFSAKVKLAYAMNVIEADARRDLDNIRCLRNAFAHAQIPLHFDMPEVSAVCDLLCTAYPPVQPGARTSINHRDRFVNTCFALYTKLRTDPKDPDRIWWPSEP